MKKRRRKTIREYLWETTPWIAGALVVLSSGLSATVIWETVELWRADGALKFDLVKAFYLFIFIGGLYYLKRRIKFKPRTRHLKDIVNPPPREHLILILSYLDTNRGEFNGVVPVGLDLTTDLKSDLEMMMKLKNPAKSIKWNWEMPLRALYHHHKKLQTVTLIGSKKSIKQIPLFLDICRKYTDLQNIRNYYVLDQDPERIISAEEYAQETVEGWNFESFDELSDGMYFLFNWMEEKGIREKDIIVDFTGGQKITSAVAAASTLNRNIKIQYVQTEGNCNVLSYDVYLATSDIGDFGV